jgi:hypothetical protein
VINQTANTDAGNVYGVDGFFGALYAGSVGSASAINIIVTVSGTQIYWLNARTSQTSAQSGGILGSMTAIRIG